MMDNQVNDHQTLVGDKPRDRKQEMSANSSRLERNLSREAVALALRGEWERATEVNRAILELFEHDVPAMNRLGKSLMEMGDYTEAKEVFDRVVRIAPYNNIARKNSARLDRLVATPVAAKQVRKGGAAPQLFLEESGKSGTTLLRKPAQGQVTARITPSDPADLVVEQDSIKVYTRQNEYLGQIEPKLARRLKRLMGGGNAYDAAILGSNDKGISIIVRETHRARALNDVSSFPSRIKEGRRVYLDDTLARYNGDDNFEDEDSPAIDEEAMSTDWNDGE